MVFETPLRVSLDFLGGDKTPQIYNSEATMNELLHVGETNMYNGSCLIPSQFTLSPIETILQLKTHSNLRISQGLTPIKRSKDRKTIYVNIHEEWVVVGDTYYLQDVIALL